MLNAHVELDQLARCAEGTLGREDADRVREHLAECRSCMAAYVDSVRYRAAWLAVPETFEAGASDRRHARAIAGVPSRHAWPSSRLVPMGLTLAGATAAVVLGIAMWSGGDSGHVRSRPGEAPVAGVRHATGEGLMLPTSEVEADALHAMRSGPATGGATSERELKTEIDAYEAGARGEADCARLIGLLLANGESETARDYATECVRLHPSAVSLLVFAADAHYRTSDLAGAEDLLRRASRVAPRDPLVTLDLGLTLGERGERAESRRILEAVARSGQAPFAARARRELGNR